MDKDIKYRIPSRDEFCVGFKYEVKRKTIDLENMKEKSFDEFFINYKDNTTKTIVTEEWWKRTLNNMSELENEDCEFRVEV